ncbi:site-specific DNA-methyltransferase [Henriciella marina]|uniref:site-specific DNA-methyltransferase n=1 Tax=Henriciella marina TaxID=453851 RepID=UPI00039A814B|nr:DNA methyltransferase [Henriciella marina]
MSRLTDLIAQTKAKDEALGRELEREFKMLASRRSFGLNFERHRPESVELPGRPVRRGDKVRVLPVRADTSKGDSRLWKVIRIERSASKRLAHLQVLDGDDENLCTVDAADLCVVAEFRDYIYPGLVSTGKVERGGDKPFHTVINGENFHALEALTYTHRGKIDAIYIDPPYNTGAKDWKYNNDYVEDDDLYRHSKWLAFMERRILVARELLNAESSVLIVTIDEKEYLRLGLLLEQTFPGARIQMISSVINPNGTSRPDSFNRVDEYIYFVRIGRAPIAADVFLEEKPKEVRWDTFRRHNPANTRDSRPNQFYAIFVDPSAKKIVRVGEPLPLDVDRHSITAPEGLVAVFPVRDDGTEMMWSTRPEVAWRRAQKGYLRVGAFAPDKPQAFSIAGMYGGGISDIENGRAEITKRMKDGSVRAHYTKGKAQLPTTNWTRASHNARTGGSDFLAAMLPGRRFPFPKSIYAVEDALRYFLAERPRAMVLDFFAGSGTTAHAIMRLNKQDGGRRQCISVTNNEVAADEQKALCEAGLRPGDTNWETWGICDHITKPRIAAAITGKTPDGNPIKGDYKFTDEFPMADGFEENAEFFTLTYEAPISVGHNKAFARIAPLLWMKAGSEGRRIETLPENGWDVADTYGLLTDLDQADAYCATIGNKSAIRIAYIVTDDERRFQSVAQDLPDGVEPVRLYESYLTNFRFSMGR